MLQTTALIHKEVRKHSPRISKAEPFIGKYNWD